MTENAARMDAVVALAAPVLEHARFRRRGRRGFIRETEPGFVHVVQFAMGQVWQSRHRSFSVAVGIHIDEAASFYWEKHSRSPTVVDCEVRDPYGELGPLCDRDWRLADDVAATAADVQRHLIDDVLTYLDGLRSRQALIEAHATGRQPGLPPRGDLTIALLLSARGETHRAQSAVEQYLGDSEPGHREWVEQRLAEKGLPAPSSRSNRLSRRHAE